MLLIRLDKGFNCKGIVLARNAEALLHRSKSSSSMRPSLCHLAWRNSKSLAIRGRLNALLVLLEGEIPAGFLTALLRVGFAIKELFSCGVMVPRQHSKNVFKLLEP